MAATRGRIECLPEHTTAPLATASEVGEHAIEHHGMSAIMAFCLYVGLRDGLDVFVVESAGGAWTSFCVSSPLLR